MRPSLRLLILPLLAGLFLTSATPGQTRTKGAEPPGLTPAQQEAIRHAAGLPPGTVIIVEETDEGSVTVTESGTGQGGRSLATGDKVTSAGDVATPPINLPGGAGAGAATASAKNRAESDPSSAPWRNPLFWGGLLLVAGAGVCLYLRLHRPATWLAIAGGACVAAAFFPWLLPVGVVVALLVVAGPGLMAEWQKRKVEADRDAHAVRAAENESAARSIVNAIDALRAREPAVAAAMKAHKGDILGALTPEAIEIVEDERTT